MTPADEDDFWESLESESSIDGQVQDAIEAASDDEVVCRVCGTPHGQIVHQHLQIHDMTLDEYRREYPDAPIYPDAPARQPGREVGFRQSEETKRKISRGMKEQAGDDEE